MTDPDRSSALPRYSLDLTDADTTASLCEAREACDDGASPSTPVSTMLAEASAVVEELSSDDLFELEPPTSPTNGAAAPVIAPRPLVSLPPPPSGTRTTSSAPPAPPPRRASLKKPPEPTVVVSSLPDVRPPAPGLQPTATATASSLTPLALDAPAEPQHEPEATVVIARRRRGRMAQSAAIGGAVAASLVVMFGVGSLIAGRSGAARSPVAHPAPAPTPVVRARAAEARACAAEGPKEPEWPAEARNEGTPAEEASAAPAESASPQPGAVPKKRWGTLRVPPSITGMLVDGHPRRVNGEMTLSCGRHAIKTSITPARIVEVPCGGTAWL